MHIKCFDEKRFLGSKIVLQIAFVTLENWKMKFSSGLKTMLS